MRSSEQISAEILQTFGFLPPFYEPSLPMPQVLENLWQQTLLAYIDSPLPALFLERLNAYLSRFCVVPYCMVSHSAALRPLGMTARQVLTLLETPPPSKRIWKDISTSSAHSLCTRRISPPQTRLASRP